MNNYSPIVPPPELVDKWFNQSPYINPEGYIAIQAAQWGADQELDACAEWVGSMFHGYKTWADELRADRRPRPPTLKEQGLAALDQLKTKALCSNSVTAESIIRLALQALPND